MFRYGGENRFGSRFDFFEWSAPYYENAEEVFMALNALDLTDKTLTAINAIGACNGIGNSCAITLYQTITDAGIDLGDLWWEEYENLDNVLVPWSFSLCEPLQLVFNDGTTLEVMPTESGGARIGTNSIPIGLVNGLNPASVDATVFFKELMGKKLKKIELKIESKETEYIGYYNIKQKDRYKQIRKRYSIQFDLESSYELEISQGWASWFSVSAKGGDDGEKIPYRRGKDASVAHRCVEIVNGRDGGGTFWIIGINSKGEKKTNLPALDCFGISIDENDVSEFLSEFLRLNFDPSIQEREEYDDPGFDWYGVNLYTSESVRRMLSDLRRVAEWLQNDYDNPALAQIKSHWSCYPYTNKKISEMTTEEINEVRKQVVPVAVDFYERFCERLEHMLKIPGNDMVSFAGP